MLAAIGLRQSAADHFLTAVDFRAVAFLAVDFRPGLLGRRLPGRGLLGRRLPGRGLLGRRLPGRGLLGRRLPGRGLLGRRLPGRGLLGRRLPGRGLLGRRLPGRGLLGRRLLAADFSDPDALDPGASRRLGSTFFWSPLAKSGSTPERRRTDLIAEGDDALTAILVLLTFLTRAPTAGPLLVARKLSADHAHDTSPLCGRRRACSRLHGCAAVVGFGNGGSDRRYGDPLRH